MPLNHFFSTRMKSLSTAVTDFNSLKAKGRDQKGGPVLCVKLAEQALRKLNIFRGKFYERDSFHLLITEKQYSH